MEYRKYAFFSGVLFFILFVGCASAPKYSSENLAQDEAKYDGREPASLRGEVGWLSEVEDDFGRIASETSSRALASQMKQEVLVKKANWKFSYQPKSNRFFVEVQGVSYPMVQTRINDEDRFSFAAEGQSENPVTFSVEKNEGRGVASGFVCVTEVSFWNKKSKTYSSEKAEWKGKSCDRLLNSLKDYVP